MSNVIPFPTVPPAGAVRPAAAPTPSVEKLTADELCALTEMDFPESVTSDNDGWLLIGTDEDSAQLERYLHHHGLGLSPFTSAFAASQLWSELRRRFGQGVRLTAVGRAAEVSTLCSHLNLLEQAYACAVGEQDLESARRLAAKVFTRSEQRSFQV